LTPKANNSKIKNYYYFRLGFYWILNQKLKKWGYISSCYW
jgi:hypothetical protein